MCSTPVHMIVCQSCLLLHAKGLQSDSFLQSSFCVGACSHRLHLVNQQLPLSEQPILLSSHIFLIFLSGQQGEIRPVPGEGVQGENKPVLHVRRTREENPRVQAAGPQLPAHHHHVQPYVDDSFLRNPALNYMTHSDMS